MLFNIDLMISNILRDSKAFLPELILCGGILVLLLMRLFSVFDRLHLGWVALAITLGALAVCVGQWQGCCGFVAPEGYSRTASDAETGLDKALPMYTGLLVYDRLTLFIRLFLLGFSSLVIWLSLTTGIPDREDSSDFYTLLLGATLGMALMGSANHLLMVFIAVEMASIPSYALAGYLKGRRSSSEAALKYVVYGGGAAGVMLYGISLLAGKFGTGYLPDLAVGYVHALGGDAVFDPVMVLGTLFILIGIAFKLAAVPFHFWCPDVFEGASAEVAGFLSVASKGAALALLARLCLTLSGSDPLVTFDEGNWMSVVKYLLPAIGFFAAITATFGNLAAYAQTNLKRLLAYSTIAHAGYMMMGVAILTREGLSAVLFYLVAYLVMNLGAFAVVAYIRNQIGSEDLEDYRGLIRRSPWMTVTLCVFLLSLLGIPPLVGFVAKFQIFAALYHGGEMYSALGQPGLSTMLYGLLVIGGINTVFSAVYYIKVMKVMIIEERLEDVEGREPEKLAEPIAAVSYVGIMALLILGLGIIVNPLVIASQDGAERFAKQPVQVSKAEEAK